MYHQILYIRQKENGRTSIPWCLCVFIQLVWCCGPVLFKFCHAFMPLDGHAQFGYTCLACSNRENWCFFQVTVLCQSLEDKPFFNNVCFWEHFRSYHDSGNDLAFIISHKRGERWQTGMAEILHQIFYLNRGRSSRNGELHFGKVLLSCRFESNTDARKDLPVIVQVTRDRRKFLYLPYSNCLKQSTNLKLSSFTVSFW